MNTSEKMRAWGWRCFTLMWLPFIFIFIGMSSLPDGSYAWAQLPLLARVSLAATGTLLLLSVALHLGASTLSAKENRLILANGQVAQATILKIQDTGATVNQNPVVRLILEVHPSSGDSFQAETERTISRLEIPQIQPGKVISVKFDPQTKEVAIQDA